MKESEKENNWFKQYEKELLENAARKRDKKRQEAAAKQGQKALDELRAAHWLKCPKCGHDMEVMSLEGIEVENCTFCKGIYFDRDELESLLLRKTPQRFKFYRKFFGLD
jgi:hypothetical protein